MDLPQFMVLIFVNLTCTPTSAKNVLLVPSRFPSLLSYADLHSFAIAIVVIGALLHLAISSLPNTGNLWSLGFGTVHPQALINGWSISNLDSPNKEILASVLIANLPQALLSLIYVTLNGLCTSMFLGEEWSRFAHHRKALRVSDPKGSQRKTYFLQLPYRISLPMMVMSGLLHWLVSQSVFLAVVAEYAPDGSQISAAAVATCGFSPVAMIFVIVAGILVVLAAVAGGCRQYKPGMPLVGSCSAAISAACHGPFEEQRASTKSLQWGVVSEMVGTEGIGHCCFSTGTVTRPVEGQLYAGTPESLHRR